MGQSCWLIMKSENSPANSLLGYKRKYGMGWDGKGMHGEGMLAIAHQANQALQVNAAWTMDRLWETITNRHVSRLLY